MAWIKKGLIYEPTGEWWAQSHGFVPTPEICGNGIIRIYFSTRDKDFVSRIRCVEMDCKNIKKIKYLSPEPVLDIGEFGCFDESGVVPCCIIKKDEEKRLYYFGWQKTNTGAYLLLCGLAISKGQKNEFKRYANTPILERNSREPFVRSTVFVMEENGIYRMWYTSGYSWTTFNGKPCPKYNIRYAESNDGIMWKSTDKICIGNENKDEFGFARPWIIKRNNKYYMWYSVRSHSFPYRIGYAESENGVEWERKDALVGIQRSKIGWDSQMICFASIVSINGKSYMFYNGNKHGLNGFGYAENNDNYIYN